MAVPEDAALLGHPLVVALHVGEPGEDAGDGADRALQLELDDTHGAMIVLAAGILKPVQRPRDGTRLELPVSPPPA